MTTPLPVSPFITDPDRRFVLDEAAFLSALQTDGPAVERDPSPEFLSAAHMKPLLEVLNAY